MSIGGLGSIGGAYIGGVLADMTGTYASAIQVAIVTQIANAAVSLALKKPRSSS